MIKKISIWLFVIIVGFLFYVLSQIPFQMGFLGGFRGSNLTLIALIQAVCIISLLYVGLRCLKLRFRDIGWTAHNWKKDALLGAIVAICWAIVQFAWIFPHTGGAERADIKGILTMLEHDWHNILWYLPLGVIGGALTEELYNRGFFIGALSASFNHSRVVVYLSAILSIIFFSAGHLPSNLVEWIDLLIPSTAYALLYLYTKRLTASMVAHGLWNTLAVTLIILFYS
ncbi:CPBP family intramembrane glutamic endopeptidase [Marininema halotolerans]|uniref:CAAX prenyl protease 2/Lysostaphin resistance protein A-like domain-containing protein n=1 Tax=Marininema halotolerans TaxID=1155944 RepID=A0A1I6PPU1_9BACL|nr:type II CAAX endopeptidase family protein [Marininema halotolerans]SFS42140.1 hypothetical protein SAMN05444972_10252 [Marininema halotolerans]